MPGEVCFLRALTARQLDRMADETLDWTALSLLKLASRRKKDICISSSETDETGEDTSGEFTLSFQSGLENIPLTARQ